MCSGLCVSPASGGAGCFIPANVMSYRSNNVCLKSCIFKGAPRREDKDLASKGLSVIRANVSMCACTAGRPVGARYIMSVVNLPAFRKVSDIIIVGIT